MNASLLEHSLQFDSIREGVKALCHSPLGRERVDAMVFHREYETIRMLLNPLREMIGLLSDASLSMPQGDVDDLREALARIRVEGLFLDEHELLSLKHSLGYAGALKAFLSRLDGERFPLLSIMHPEGDNHADIEATVTEIDQLLDQYGQLRDTASPELSRIRHDIRRSQGSVTHALTSILNQAKAEGIVDKDIAPTMREGRLVLPVPPAYKRRFGGIVHDESATGKTVFIEPAAVVEANNHLRELDNEERRERMRILTDFSKCLRPRLPAIYATSDWLGEMDFLRAKAAYALSLHAIVPEISGHPDLNWREARHPLLWQQLQRQGRESVPLDIQLDSERRILVISGPNAGGKSVCLKTVALLQYMVQCGMAVPMGEASHMGLFDDILIDIGDKQSIEDDLSTYSSHLSQMKTFLNEATPLTLLLIDEFGTGTEPLLGGAIAEAVLTQLNRQGAWGVITTHYTNLKHLAERTPGIINGAMLYDRGQMRPLYRLSIGQAGSSFAVEIARQIGLPTVIIDHASQLIGAEHIDYDRQLQDIARDKRYWENKRQNIRQREKHLEERIAYYEGEITNLKAKRREVIDEAHRQAAELLQKSNATIERTIRDIRQSQADKEKTKEARKKIENLKQQVTDSQPNAKRKPKKTSKAETQAQTGGTGKQSRVLHDLSDLSVLSKNPTRIITETNTPRVRVVSSGIADELRRKKLAFSRDLDMRGLRADEAQSVLIDYIDTAIMVGADQVTILHGTGTGALKQIVRDYLTWISSRHSGTTMHFHDGDPDRGGAGITVVEFQ